MDAGIMNRATASPASTARANDTIRPNRPGARRKLNQGVVAYVRRYKPATGPNDSQHASIAMLPYRATRSRSRRPPNHPATTPPIPSTDATQPGKSTSLHVWRTFRIHAWAYAEDAK